MAIEKVKYPDAILKVFVWFRLFFCVYVDFILRDDMTNYRASDYYHLGAVSIATCGVSLDLAAHLLKLCVDTYDDILYCFKASFASWILLWFIIITGELRVTAEA